jgi:hypothetical protein
MLADRRRVKTNADVYLLSPSQLWYKTKAAHL